MGLCINTTKTETMCIGPEAEFFIDQIKLENVNNFKHLGSYVTNDCSMKDYLTARIQTTSCAFGRLRHRVFDSHDLTYLTKVKVYNQCLMPLLMYGSETWTLNYQQVRQLRTVQQRHLRRILKIKWDHYISNEEALARACVEDIEILLVRSRLRWLGHVSRMEDDRPVKSLLYGELTEGTRPVGRPKLRYKDTCKSALKCGNALGQWKAMVENRTEWRHIIRQTCNKVNEKRVNAYERQRDMRRRKENLKQ